MLIHINRCQSNLISLFRENGRHMLKYIKWKCGYQLTPKASVDFWYSEKALYQEIVARFIIYQPTNLSWQWYLYENWCREFARVGRHFCKCWIIRQLQFLHLITLFLISTVQMELNSWFPSSRNLNQRFAKRDLDDLAGLRKLTS